MRPQKHFAPHSRQPRGALMEPPHEQVHSEYYDDEDEDGCLVTVPAVKPATLPSTTDTDELRAFRNQWKTELKPHQQRGEPSQTTFTAPTLPRTTEHGGVGSERARTVRARLNESDEREQDIDYEQAPLDHLLHGDYHVESARPDAPAYIGVLPTEILTRILSSVDVHSLEAASAVCRRWFAVARDNGVWRVHCIASWGASSHTAVRSYGRSYRNLYLKKPRIRTDGLYVSKNSYFRSGVREGSFNHTVHHVVYYRYLRFYSDGSVVAWTGPEVPREVAEWLRSERTARPFSRGCWQLNQEKLQLWVESPSLVHGRRTTFTMALTLSSTIDGRNNRLQVDQYGMQVEGEAPNTVVVDIAKYFFARLPPHLL